MFDNDARTRSPAELARVVLEGSLKLNKGSSVVIETWDHTRAIAEEFVAESRRLGARPVLVYQSESAFWDSLDRQRLESLSGPPASLQAALRASQAYVYFPGPGDLERVRSLPEETRATLWGSHGGPNGYWEATARALGVPSVRMEIGNVTESDARLFGVDVVAWRRELEQASAVDPFQLQHDARRLIDAIGTGREIEIAHPNGTRLAVRLLGTRPWADDGVIDTDDRRHGQRLASVPAGIVSLALDEKLAEGRFVANLPTRKRQGAFDGADLRFRKGLLESFRFRSGEAAFLGRYATASDGRDRPAMIEFGLNPHIRNAPNVEGLGRGTITLRIGDNFQMGGRTRIGYGERFYLTGADVRVDGRPVIRQGELA